MNVKTMMICYIVLVSTMILLSAIIGVADLVDEHIRIINNPYSEEIS